MSKLQEAAKALGKTEEQLAKEAIESLSPTERRLYGSRSLSLAIGGTCIPVIEDYCARKVALEKKE